MTPAPNKVEAPELLACETRAEGQALKLVRKLVIELETWDADLLDVLRATPQAALLREWLGKPTRTPDERIAEIQAENANYRKTIEAIDVAANAEASRIVELANALKPFADFGNWLLTQGERWQNPNEELQIGDFAYSFSVSWVQRATIAYHTSAPDERIAGLVSALRRIAEGNLGDASWQANYAKIRQVAVEALATFRETGRG